MSWLYTNLSFHIVSSVAFDHGKGSMEQEIPKLADVVTLPVLHSRSQLVDGLLTVLSLDRGVGLLEHLGGGFDSGGDLVFEIFLGVAAIAKFLTHRYSH